MQFQICKSHQNVDTRDARINRDIEDVPKLHTFLFEYNRFEYIDNLRNFVTRLIGTEEIDFHNALAIGI